MNSCVVYIFTVIFTSGLILRSANSNVCTPESCSPSTIDLTAVRDAVIRANSTCGVNKTEDFCVNQNCDYKCDNTDPSNYHGVNLTIDNVNDDTYWKSENLKENVVLDLDLGHPYFFVEITATFAFSYPAAMYFSTSDDHGASWRTLVYFSSDCAKYFNMTAVEDNDRDGFIVQCFRLDSANTKVTELKASYQPWRDQQFAANIHQNYTLQQEFLATNFRMVLVKFEVPPGFDPTKADERIFYFAVQDWYIRGRCYCHGQSGECNAEESWKCNCLKNTTGDQCEKCSPLFNNQKYESGKACTGCQCNNHSLSCEYDPVKDHGVCQNCTGFTTGDTCNQCLPYYYEALLPAEHPDRCQACQCNDAGITGEPGSDLCDETTGLCECKSNVTGRTCGECKNGYWNLRKDNPYGCQRCICEPAGTLNGSTVCDKETGQCKCRDHLVGLECTRCEDGYFGLTYKNPSPCEDCSCSRVGSVNITCEQTTGSCFCREKFTDNNCSTLETGYYVPGVPEMTYEAEQADPSAEYHDLASNITGVLIDGTSASRSVVFNVNIPKTTVYALVVRYQTLVEWKDVSLKVESLLNPFSPFSCNENAPVTNRSFVLTANVPSSSTAINFGDSCLVEGPYRITLDFPALATSRSGAPKSTEALVDSLVILPSVKNISNPKADNETLTFYMKAFSFDSWSRNKENVQKALGPYYSYLYDGGKSCSCNETGSVNRSSCDSDGGQCHCKPNVHGLNCDRCKPGFYSFSDTGCKECNCDLVGSKGTLCDQLTGKCQCKEGVIGQQCTQCRANYYGFNNGTGCSPCLCDQQYSRNLQCDGNSGVCDCLPGVKLPKCHVCNETSFNLTLQGCDDCNCDEDGSASLNCNKQTGECLCKTLAVGTKCNSCLKGFYYGLDKSHPTGCLKCQCSGKTVNCSSKPNMYESSVATELDPVTIDITKFNWTSTIGNLTSGIGVVNGSFLGFIEYTSNTNEVAYFKAPAKYLGDKRTAYQHNFTFFLRQDHADNPFDTIKGDVILKGKWFPQNLVYKFDKSPGDDFSEFSVFFGEEYWKVGNTTGRNATSYEMVMVLSELEGLWIRAKWSNTTPADSAIARIAMAFSKEYNSSAVSSDLRMTKSVELCECPREFTGDSCERCAEGFTRMVPNSGPYTTCVPCSCNGNSDRCDPDIGVCIGCKHNTTGDHCERCSTGYYGNATLGSQHPCKACLCYGGHNSCHLTSDGSFKCECSTGYEGDQCENCTDGHYGIPTEPNGICRSCHCHSNAPTCNRTTGDCSPYCEKNTAGFNCQFCKAKFFGDATSDVLCQACNCSSQGSVNNTCDRLTGDCHCFQNVIGRTCSKCKPEAWGYYDNETGCKDCGCSSDGTLKDDSGKLQCNATTGICPCKVNVTGSQCDRCIDGLFGVSLGCVDCNCNMTYSNHTICDPRNGQCQCKQSSAGGFYGGRQCTDCRWDAVGSFPTCAQCNETCYENWYHLIAEERNKVNELSQNVTNVLQIFDGNSVEDINKKLSELNKKLADSEKIFKGSELNLTYKDAEYNKTREKLTTLTSDLDKANETLTEIMSYLDSVISPFDGTVTVNSTVPPVQANYTTIRNWAEQILQEVERNNRTAHQNYENIMSLYDQIKQHNSSGAEAAEEVKQSVKRLDDITNKINETKSILNQDFYDNVRENNRKLEKLSQDSKEVSRLVNESSLISHAASEMLDHAQGNISEAQDKAKNNLKESYSAYNDSVEVQKRSYEAMNTSHEFKANSSKLLTQVETALTEVKTSIDDMSRARSNLGNATEIADEVLAMTIPVKEQTINDLSQQILSIEIDRALVNETLKNATKRLEIAKEAQQLAERAVNISNTTLEQVREIEIKIVEAHQRRQEARKLQNSTDQMVTEINRITEQVEDEYSEAKTAGEATLILLNRTIEEIDKSLDCFNESKQLVMDASRMANLAYNQIIIASNIHNESETTLRDIETKLNTSYTIAMTSYRNITATYQDASKLYDEVKEAEDLLKHYIAQRDEMDSLTTEVDQLETQLETLNDDLDKKLQEYESCNGDG
ncbi:laminin subunit alpha-like [Dendronephthya gigantea]|uniref:laminin subunit alpha-like n=1 Tax=Dendronephthya gigantea TaxID=151771 RepID=UPI00106CB360|nr:laminin subunit alpha-like [Dendronephthya gigantea]